jgi:rubrerythrin
MGKVQEMEMAKEEEEILDRALDDNVVVKEMVKIGSVMVQKGQPIKQWVCPFCGNIKYTSIYETNAPICPACVSSGKVYSYKESKEYYEVKEIGF